MCLSNVMMSRGFFHMTTDKLYLIDEDFYALDKESPRKAAKELMRRIERLLNDDNLFELKLLLKNIEIGRLSSNSCIGLIRPTGRVRHFFPDTWDECFAEVKLRLKQLKKDASVLLVGMDQLPYR